MYVNDGVGAAILQTNRLEIDTAGNQPPPYPASGPGGVSQIFSNITNDNVLGEPDVWIEIRHSRNTYSVPGYSF
jgi:hypothetical protein